MAPAGTITAFLTCCALHEAQHLGAEVLRAVGPADAAARDRREAQVHALDARASRPRSRGRAAAAARRRPRSLSSLKAMVCWRPASRRRLEEVGAHGGADQIEVAGAGCGPRRGSATAASAPSMRCRIGCSRGAARLGDRSLRAGSKRRWNSSSRSRATPACRGQRVGDVARAERRAELAQVGGVGAQQRRLAPVGTGRDDQPVEAVVVGSPREHGEEARPRAA